MFHVSTKLPFTEGDVQQVQDFDASLLLRPRRDGFRILWLTNRWNQSYVQFGECGMLFSLTTQMLVIGCSALTTSL